MPDSPDAREMFEGGDIKWGLEVCKRLKAEGLGVPVIYQDSGNRKVDRIDLRQPGDRDESFRIREQLNEKLLGVILSVDRQKNEFVYISAGEEQGMVFKEESDYWNLKYKNDGLPFLMSHNSRSFVSFVNSSASDKYGSLRCILTEDSDPQRYAEVVEMAIKNGRQRQNEIKQKRGETRKNLLHKLFDGE